MAKKQPSRIKNLTIAGILALTGCLTVVIALVALFIGLWLDSLIGQRGPATILLLVLSAPLSLYLMVRIALGLVKHIDPPTVTQVASSPSQDKEE